MNRPNWKQYFINIAEVVATRSHDAQTQVGAVIVDKQNRIVSTGYNGFPPGSNDDNLPTKRPEKYPYMIHAEMNAIINSKQSLHGTTLYCTLMPCHECCKAIISAGITTVVYKDDYIANTKSFLQEFGIIVTKINESIPNI